MPKKQKKRKLKSDHQFLSDIRGLANFAKAHVETMRKRKLKKKLRHMLLSHLHFELKSIIDNVDKLEKQIEEDECEIIKKEID